MSEDFRGATAQQPGQPFSVNAVDCYFRWFELQSWWVIGGTSDAEHLTETALMLEKSFVLPMDMSEFLTMAVSPIEVNYDVFWPHDNVSSSSALTLLVGSFDHPKKPVPDMTYNVFGGTLSLTVSSVKCLISLSFRDSYLQLLLGLCSCTLWGSVV